MTDYVHIPFAQNGTNTSSESRNPCLDVRSVRADEWERSSYETDELFLQAITALRRAVQVASTDIAREGVRVSSLEAPTTRVLVPASPFTQRLTHYCGLIETIVEELRSIAPTSPATAVADSSKDQESSESSRQKVYLTSEDKEPAYGSIVLDTSGDAWQRDWEQWSCAIDDNQEYCGWTWQKLTRMYSRVELLYTPEDR